MKEEIGLVQLHYMPCISMFMAMYRFDTLNFQLDRPYGKMSFRNRCLIADSQGLQTLSIPIRGGRGFRGDYGNVIIDDRQPWNVHHWRAVYSAYGRAPWFEHYASELEHLFTSPPERLSDWNIRCLQWICKSLDISFKVVNTYIVPDEMFPNHPVIPLMPVVTPQDYQAVGHGPLPTYLQVFQDKNGFISNLSMLDFILCAGPRMAKAWLHSSTGEVHWHDL